MSQWEEMTRELEKAEERREERRFCIQIATIVILLITFILNIAW